MITTLRTLSAALRRWQHKQEIRRKIAQGHRSRARRAQEREVEMLRYDAQEALSLAETAISMLPDFSQRKFRRKLEHLRGRIEVGDRLVFGSPEANAHLYNERAFAERLVRDLWQLYPYFQEGDTAEPPAEGSDWLAMGADERAGWVNLRDRYSWMIEEK